MYQILSDQEIEKLLSGARKFGLRDFTILYFALSTGLRCSELVGLKYEDIAPFGLPSSILTVPVRLAKRGKKRDIPLNSETKEIISKYILIQKNFNKPTSPDSYFFTALYSHNPLSSRDFQRITSQISIEYIGRSITPHILRHTFATRLLKITNIRVVQELLGHSRLQTTQIYTHVNSADTQLAVDQLRILISHE
ncbi:MAG: tyrosine-type recombinase/integrase [Bacteroidetes bacterium]|nr:tyrosine-type recombinase/integrase [Bacteroidota bacterium]